MAIKVLIADDHGIMRQGLRSLLQTEPDVEVVGEADSGREALKKVDELLPDVVLMDVTMSDLNGMDATAQMRRQFPEVKVIGLSMHRDEHFVAGMLLAGASGYVLKEATVEELIGAIHSVAKGGFYLSPGIAKSVVKGYLEYMAKTNMSVRPPLSPREREVLQLVAEGKSSKEIADRLNVSPRTVEAHRRRIMDKLGIDNIADLTKYAIRIGLTILQI